MNVFCPFDGISATRVVLDRLEIPVNNYYSSEIDKPAITIAQKNYPDTIQLGDVCDISGSDLPKIDLMVGGSPCQGFSFAGKQLNFDDPRSVLFFEFVRLLKECKPDYFLLENVKMKQEYQDIISKHLGVQPVKINSSLVSAQNRVRLYWTNIPGVGQPKDKGILLKDILEDLPIEKELAPYMTGEFDGVSRLDKGIFNFTDKDKGAAQTGSGGHANKYLIHRPCELKEFKQDSTCHHAATATDIKGNESIKRVYADSGKSPTLTTMGGGHREPKVLTAANYDYMRYEHPTYRKLTPIECERLQTFPDDYTDGISKTQRYKCLGNSFTVDVIAHILSNMDGTIAEQQEQLEFNI
jgi:DNA (cytosine-5)-methyltransferase 3A